MSHAHTQSEVATRKWTSTRARAALGIVALAMLLGLTATARAAEVTVVVSSDAQPYRAAFDALKKQLLEKQHRVRKSLLSDLQKSDGALRASPAGFMVAIGTPAALWLHKELPARSPLVYAMVAAPEAIGLTKGRTTFGVSTDVPAADQFKLISAALPATRSIGMLYHSQNPASLRIIEEAKAGLPAGWRLDAVAIDKHESVATAIDSLLSRQIDVVWSAADGSVYNNTAVRALLLAALRKRKPVFGFSPAFVQAGALIGVGVDPEAQGQRAAELALKLIAGGNQSASPSLVLPADHQVAVNLVVAKELKIELPRSLVDRATYVVRPGKETNR